MDFAIICLVAFLASGLTLFSGFGLGTILVPAFTLFFPVELSIALTAIVHFLNNIFKLLLLGKFANKSIIIKFGIPSMIAALGGAYLLTLVSGAEPMFSYTFFSEVHEVMPIKLLIAFLLIFFALFDIIPSLSSLQFSSKYLPFGGLLSGFFGGLSGNQGALRSAFLMRAGLSKEAFIATGVVIACIIDVSRLSVYSTNILNVGDQINIPLMLSATLSAFLGAYLGNKFLKKITIKSFQYTVSIAIIVFGIFLGLGFI